MLKLITLPFSWSGLTHVNIKLSVMKTVKCSLSMILEKENCVVGHSIISAKYIIDTQLQE